jgi:hypothetical protein
VVFTHSGQPYRAISQRFLTFPAELLERVFKELLPKLRQAWQERHRRSLPESVQFTLSKVSAQYFGVDNDCIRSNLYKYSQI